MGKAPAFQFYPMDWARDLEEHPLEIEGAWIRLCCKLWWSETRGTLTKTLTQWSRILRVGEKKSLSIITYLLDQEIADGVIQTDGITITSRRMVHDERIRQIRIEAGSKGGNPALKKPSKDGFLHNQTEVNQNPTPSSSSSSLSSSFSSKTKEKRQGAPSGAFDLPDDIDPDVWRAFEESRKKLKAPLTERAADLILNELQKIGQNKNAVLNQSVMNGWKGVFPLKRQGGFNGNENNAGTGSGTSTQDTRSGTEGGATGAEAGAYPVDFECFE